MPAGISAELPIGRVCRITRQAVGLVAVLAVLLQAILFAWHHHAPPFRARAIAAATTLAAPAAPVIPALDDHDCQICSTLSHHGAVPVNFFAPSPREQAPMRHTRLAALDTALAPYLLFQPRAPPAA
jgi:hypothetical protein